MIPRTIACLVAKRFFVAIQPIKFSIRVIRIHR